MNLLGWLVRASGWSLAAAVLASTLGGVGAAALVAAIHRALGAPTEALPRQGLEFAALAAAVIVCRWLSEALFVELSQATLARLRLRVSALLSEAPYREIEAQGQGRLLSVLTADVHTVSEFFVALPRLVSQGAVILGCLAYLAVLSLPAFGFAMAVVVLGSLRHSVRVRRASEHLVAARDGEDALYGDFCALFSGAKELKLNTRRREAFLSEVLGPNVDAVRRHRTRGLLIFVAAGSWGALMFFVVIGGVIFLLSPWLDIPVAVRSGYALVFLYMMHPMEALLEAIPALSRTQVSLERMHGVGATSPRGLAVPAPGRSVPALASVALAGATHRYRRDDEDGLFQLGPISLELRKGEIVFLAGGNGSGKTTLAKLLVGLYEPDAGAVLANDTPVSAAERDDYRQNFSAIFSDFHLFDSLLGQTRTALDERAKELLAALDLGHKVSIVDGVFSTTQLSRGQQKRLALLVAVLEDRAIYVFDEWAADQDPVYKDVFYRRVLPELKARGKAVFAITHDDAYFHLADRFLTLDQGRLRAPGPTPRAMAPALGTAE